MPPAGTYTHTSAIYFSVVALATLGYGDLNLRYRLGWTVAPLSGGYATRKFEQPPILRKHRRTIAVRGGTTHVESSQNDWIQRFGLLASFNAASYTRVRDTL